MAPAAPRRDWLHWIFEASLAAKGLMDGLEALSGLLLLALRHGPILDMARSFTEAQLSEHPRDWLARSLAHLAHGYSLEAQSFYGIYLLTHGLLKVTIVILLARGLLWAYPASIAVLALFILYQLHRFSFNHSPMMLVLSLLDLLVIALTLREWRMKMRA